jgi:hypothetical protein
MIHQQVVWSPDSRTGTRWLEIHWPDMRLFIQKGQQTGRVRALWWGHPRHSKGNLCIKTGFPWGLSRPGWTSEGLQTGAMRGRVPCGPPKTSLRTPISWAIGFRQLNWDGDRKKQNSLRHGWGWWQVWLRSAYKTGPQGLKVLKNLWSGMLGRSLLSLPWNLNYVTKTTSFSCVCVCVGGAVAGWV